MIDLLDLHHMSSCWLVYCKLADRFKRLGLVMAAHSRRAIDDDRRTRCNRGLTSLPNPLNIKRDETA
jgi:hypothetical protein